MKASTAGAGPDRYDVIVVGGGIAGLACAERFAEGDGRVLVLEREDGVGGMLRSDVTRGFVVDAGPQTVRSGDPDLFGHLESLGLGGERLTADPGGKRFVLRNGRMVALPGSLPGMLRSPLLSAAGKARLLREPFLRPGRRPDESVDGFFRRRLGAEVADRIVDPFVSGIHAGDPRTLSMARLFPSVLEAERVHGSLARWALGRVRHPPTTRPEIFSFGDGMAAWPRALARVLGPRVRTGVDVRAVERSADGGWAVRWEGGAAWGRHVVLAVPAPAASRLLSGTADPDLPVLGRVESAPVATVALGYRRSDLPEPPAGFGVLVPAAEDRPVLGILWLSSIFPSRAPDDTVLTTTFMGGVRRPEQLGWDDPALATVAHEEHVRLLGVRAGPLFSRVTRWHEAIPQHTVDGVDADGAAGRIEDRQGGVHLAGSYRAGGASVPACWQRGRDVAARIRRAVPG